MKLELIIESFRPNEPVFRLVTESNFDLFKTPILNTQKDFQSDASIKEIMPRFLEVPVNLTEGGTLSQKNMKLVCFYLFD